METKTKVRIFRLSEQDNQTLAEVRERLSVSNDSEAIRVIIRRFAAGQVLA